MHTTGAGLYSGLAFLFSLLSEGHVWRDSKHERACSSRKDMFCLYPSYETSESMVLQTTHGCGDLIFSSHTTFALVGVLTYTEYGAVVVTKVKTAAVLNAVFSLLLLLRKQFIQHNNQY